MDAQQTFPVHLPVLHTCTSLQASPSINSTPHDPRPSLTKENPGLQSAHMPAATLPRAVELVAHVLQLLTVPCAAGDASRGRGGGSDAQDQTTPLFDSQQTHTQNAEAASTLNGTNFDLGWPTVKC